MQGAFIIDDTGSPSLETNSKFLRPDRKTWCGLIMTAGERDRATSEMRHCLELIKTHFSANEFHFYDIYNKKKSWSAVQDNVRLGFFEAFAEILRQEKYRFLVQTFHPDSLAQNGFMFRGKGIIDGFTLSDHIDAALLFLIIRFKIYAQDERLDLPYDFIVDEGRRKFGIETTHKILSGIAIDSSLKYRSSISDPLLQLADFGAFALNRSQILSCKANRTDFDNYFLKIIERADLQFINIEKSAVDLQNLNKEDYDYFQWLKNAANGTFDRSRALIKN